MWMSVPYPRSLELMRRQCFMRSKPLFFNALLETARLYRSTAVQQDMKTNVQSDASCISRIPRILFFGGDAVSTTVLHGLCTRLKELYHASHTPASLITWPSFLSQHLTVITPSLPPHMFPTEVAHRYSRQFPVVRYAVREGIPLFPVDHPKSLAKSQLLHQMLSPLPGTPFYTHLSSSLASWGEEGRKACKDSDQQQNPRPLLLKEAFDLTVVVSFRYFLPRRLLRALPSPILNVHPSLLPRYRGASPIFTTLLQDNEEGEATAWRRWHSLQASDGTRWSEEGGAAPALGCRGGGVSIIALHASQPIMDGGKLLWQRRIPIDLKTDFRTYFPLVTQVGAAGCCEVVFGSPASTDCASEKEGGVALSSNPAFVPTRVTPERIEEVRQVYQQMHDSGGLLTRPPSLLLGEGDSKFDWVSLFGPAIRSTYCDYPRSLKAHMSRAQPQRYPIFSHFSLDPFHAPLLPKDAARIHFHRMTANEAFYRWRAFVGGEEFTSTTHTSLHKECTPVGQEARLRLLRKHLRRAPQRLLLKKSVGGLEAAEPPPPRSPLLHPQMPTVQLTHPTMLPPSLLEYHASFGGLSQSCWHHTLVSIVQEGGLTQVCRFTHAIHPDLVSSAVKQELKEVEEAVAAGAAHTVECSLVTGGCLYQLPSPTPGKKPIGIFFPQQDAWCSSMFFHRHGEEGDGLLSAGENGKWVKKNLPSVKGRAERWCEEVRGAAGKAPLPLGWLFPGAAYFPHADASIGAVRCAQGWFCWRSAHLSGSPKKSQPADALRKGLAMRLGTVYVDVFDA